MNEISSKALKHKAKLLLHYKRNFEVTVDALDEPTFLEEFCWMALSCRTAQMTADIGQEDAAAMFDHWAKLIREGHMGEFGGKQMSKFGNLEQSLIYQSGASENSPGRGPNPTKPLTKRLFDLNMTSYSLH